MLCLVHDTGFTSANDLCVGGSGESNGDLTESSRNEGPQTNVLLPAIVFLLRLVTNTMRGRNGVMNPRFLV